MIDGIEGRQLTDRAVPKHNVTWSTTPTIALYMLITAVSVE